MKSIIRIMSVLLISLLAFGSPAYADISGNAGSTDATTNKAYRTLTFTLNLKDTVTGATMSLVFPKDDVFSYPNDPTLILFTNAQIVVAMSEQLGLSRNDAFVKYRTMLTDGVDATVTPTIEIYLQGPPEVHLSYITSVDQIDTLASDFTQTAKNEMNQRFFMDIDSLPPINVPSTDGSAKVVFNANYPGLTNDKIKSGYGIGMNGDARLNIDPAVGTANASGWEVKSVLQKVTLNNLTGFNVKSDIPLIVGKSDPKKTIFSSADYLGINWNVGLPADFTNNGQIFSYNIKPGFVNSYSPKAQNVFYLPVDTPDGRYNISAGKHVSASVTFNWETFLWGNDQWISVGTASNTVQATISASNQDIIVRGSMFEDDSTSKQ